MIPLDQLEYYWNSYQDLERAGELSEWKDKYPHLYNAWMEYQAAQRKISCELVYLSRLEEYPE